MSDLNLPLRNYDGIGGSYGEHMVAAKYCGLSCPPWKAEGEWQHGWVTKERNTHPESVVGSDGNSYSRRKRQAFYVARQDQVDYLKSVGYKRVIAIGLPIIYLDKFDIKRVTGSLLVMPVHSHPESNEAWDDKEYVEYIKSISSHFSNVVVCIHSSCINKGNWIGFTEAGFEIVTGAEVKDANSLQRIANLFSHFEFVTTNGFGSHVAYASYFGCKVSVSGPRIKFRAEDYSDLTLYRNAPELHNNIGVNTPPLDYMYKSYNQFVVKPWQANTYHKWAAWELGVQNKKSPSELIRLFGWDFRGRIKSELRKLKWLILRYVNKIK